jgi:aryl-alcohol dehydrogenase-like predicted oxidoreductase
MNLRTFGKTELQVSSIGLGLAALGRPGYINLDHSQDLNENYSLAAMESHTHFVLDAAYRGGVRYFDVARSYGRAEQFLGSWLRSRSIAPNEVVVGSKWGYTYTANWHVNAEVHEVKDHSLSVLTRQFRESRTHLGAYLDLYQIHSATLESGVLDNITVLGELARIKADGTAIGLTVSGPDQEETIQQAIQLTMNGTSLFDSIQATWNLLETSAGKSLAKAKEAGIAVIIKEALANGRLTIRNQEPDFSDQLNLLEEEANRLDTTIDALAISAAWSQPWVDVVLSGAATVEHIQSNLKAVDVNWDEKARQRLERLVEPPDVYWKVRDQLPWN